MLSNQKSSLQRKSFAKVGPGKRRKPFQRHGALCSESVNSPDILRK